MISKLVAAGVDVGGPRKGFHIVALCGGKYLDRFRSTDADAAAEWISTSGADVVGIDAPYRWSADGHMRSSERRLAELGVSCFATPCREKAEGHPFYTWMVNGMKLYQRLAPLYPLFDGGKTEKVCVETFPHSIACALGKRILSAGNKRSDRRTALESAGIETDGLTSIDFIDAALCALAALCLACGNSESFGSAKDGFIVVPKGLPRDHEARLRL